MISFDGRCALVTGAGSGNGEAIARKLLEEGAQVAYVDINPNSIGRLTEGKERALAVTANVGDEDSVAKAVDEVVKVFGGLDIVVNNAGILRTSILKDLSVAEWDEVFRINSTGPFIVSKAAVPHLAASAAGRGDGATSAIVNITSVEAHIVISSSGHPQVHYNASKGALLQLTRALAVECASQQVRVNAVAPGFIETPFTKEGLSSPEAQKFVLERTPMGRIGQPEDVANGVAFLASDEASWVTGTTLFVDGGWTIY